MTLIWATTMVRSQQQRPHEALSHSLNAMDGSDDENDDALFAPQSQMHSVEQVSPSVSPFISPFKGYADERLSAQSTNANGAAEMTKDSASKLLKNGLRIVNQRERFDTECEAGISAILFHPFRDILFGADESGRVWVWQYAPTHQLELDESSNGSSSNSNAESAAASRSDRQRLNVFDCGKGAKVTSLSMLNAFHDAMLICGADDGTVRVFRNAHLRDAISPVTAFLANGRVKNSARPFLVTEWSEGLGLLLSGGSADTVKVHDIASESYLGCLTTNAMAHTVAMARRPETDVNLVVAGGADNVVRCFDVRASLNAEKCVNEFRCAMSGDLMALTPTQRARSHCYYAASGEEMVLMDLRYSKHSVSRVKFKKAANAFAAHRCAPLYALGSTKQFVHICSTVRMRRQRQQTLVNEICFHDGFLGARIGPVRLAQFHPYKLLLAVGGTNRHLSLYSAAPTKHNKSFF